MFKNQKKKTETYKIPREIITVKLLNPSASSSF